MELKAEELRIGNYVFPYYGDQKEYLQVKGDDIVQCENGHYRFSPIKLTEEWLLKFGFKEDKEDLDYQKELCPFNIEILADKIASVWLMNGDKFLTRIAFVHQLQNLYHALTNEELKIE